MATWTELSVDSFESAKTLLERKRMRSSVSRAYYAAYSAITFELARTRGVTFAHGRNNPSHEQLPALIRHNLNRRRFPDPARRDLNKALRRLRFARVEADYVPSAHCDASVARNCLRDALFVLERMGMAV